MLFVIDQKPTYKWKVVVKINKDGEVSQEIFTAHFKNISQSRFKEMIKMVEDKQIDDVDVAKEVLITDRRPSGTAVIESPALSAHNFFTDYTGTSTGTNTWLHGTTAGNKVTVSCPQTDLGQPTYEESDGITMLNLPFMATPTSSGNTEFSLVYT